MDNCGFLPHVFPVFRFFVCAMCAALMDGDGCLSYKGSLNVWEKVKTCHEKKKKNVKKTNVTTIHLISYGTDHRKFLCRQCPHHDDDTPHRSDTRHADVNKYGVDRVMKRLNGKDVKPRRMPVVNFVGVPIVPHWYPTIRNVKRMMNDRPKLHNVSVVRIVLFTVHRRQPR